MRIETHALGKTFSQGWSFAMSHWVASLLTTSALVFAFSRFHPDMGAWTTVFVTWVSLFILSLPGCLSYSVGSWVMQSKTLWLLPPLPKRVTRWLGALFALVWFVIEALRPAGSKMPGYISFLYFIVLPSCIAAVAEWVRLKKAPSPAERSIQQIIPKQD